MGRLNIVVAALAVAFADPSSAQFEGGYSAAIRAQAQKRLMDAQAAALQAYTRCLQVTNDASRCGPPPQVSYPTQSPSQQRVPITDYGCVEGDMRGGLSWAQAMQACTHYEIQGYTGGYSGAIQAQSQSRLMEAQARAWDAYRRCVIGEIPGSDCNALMPSPAAQGHEPPPEQRFPVVDYGCVDGNVAGGQAWASAVQACTRYEMRATPPITDYGCVDGNVRGGQTRAQAMAACTSN